MPRKRVDLTGQRFGKLLVLERTKDHIMPSGQHATMYKCLCDCGRAKVVSHGRLREGETKSCGCLAGRPGGKTQKKTPVKPKPKQRAKQRTPDPKWDEVEMPEHELHPDGIQNFIVAFTKSCAKDFMNSQPDSEMHKQTEELLQTDYFERITGIDGTELLARLQEEYDKKHRMKRRKKACR